MVQPYIYKDYKKTICCASVKSQESKNSLSSAVGPKIYLTAQDTSITGKIMQIMI